MKYRLTIDNFRNEGYIIHKGVFLHPSVSTEEALNKSIYKYMRFEHLLNMLINNKLYIANRHTFTDLVEKGYKSNLKYLFSMDCIHKNKKEKEELAKKRFNFNYEVYNSCISCWTYDEHNYGDAKANENYLMWKTYAYQNVGCRIETTLKELIENIQVPDDYDILISNVEYSTNEWIKGNPQKDIFTKSIYYRDEQEVRLCVLCQEEKILIDINPFSVIKKVIISPFIDKEFASIIIDGFKNKYKIPIEKSKIVENYK